MLSSFSTGAPEPDRRKYRPLPEFLETVWLGNHRLVAALLGSPRALDLLEMKDPRTGLMALHIAIGRNDLQMTRMLVDAGAEFVPDSEGRMPSLIAALCETSEELQDYILEAEEKALAEQEPEA
jgi:hypothetical protein